MSRQVDDLLDLLRYRGDRGITAVDALNEVGSFRLAARIADLRAEGHEEHVNDGDDGHRQEGRPLSPG